MTEHEQQEKPGSSKTAYSSADTRQGTIVLRKNWQRWVFAAGLAGSVILMVVLW
jgi:hypothetical protein